VRLGEDNIEASGARRADFTGLRDILAAHGKVELANALPSRQSWPEEPVIGWMPANSGREHLAILLPGLPYKTVANTCTQLKAKLGVRTLPELMRIAIQHLPSASATAKTPREWS
jgi:hypothetical protein